MADTNHLEKMGKELQCPICLSLFESAVSLSCNHVFCNVCIVKSMKMEATCPVCKIPYHRREIRGAPHMDSLVSIYKGMEGASAVKARESEEKPLPSDKGKRVRATASVQKENGKNRRGSGNGLASKRKGSKKSKESDLEGPGPIVMKPSSQNKKRVQLLQNVSSHIADATESVEVAGKRKEYTEETVIRLNENPSTDKEGNLEPFFWLRDEDDEERLADSDQSLDITPADVPSFSDLKDSDHESPSKANEQEKPNPNDMFDSEMFEWTQRPCSPEILPSPVKAKVLDKAETDRTQRKLSKKASSKSTKRKAGGARSAVATLSTGVSQDCMKSPAVAKIGEKQDSRGDSIRKDGTPGTSIRKNESADENVKAKRATRSKAKSSGVQSHLNMISKEADAKKGTKRKRSSVISSSTHLVAGSNELSHGTEIVGKVDQNQTNGLSDTQPGKLSSAEKSVPKKRRKKNETNGLSDKQPGKLTSAEKSSPMKRRRKSNADSIPKDLSEKTEKRTSERRSKLDSRLSTSKVTQLRGKDIVSDESKQVSDRQDSTKKKKSMQVLEKCSTVNKPLLGGNVLLQQSDGSPTTKFICAFCQSSDDTEASGEMAHYHKGEPVSADFNGGSKVIHVHKNCAEWAPNVYFDNLTAVNLDVELTRSRRITCSGCGLKGAALGCYNKSCKNSFHVTCAKLMPECKWDNANFVMLCPLDASLKLPCEETSRKERERNCTPKKPLDTPPNQIAAKTDITELQMKPFQGLPKKMVLCCSGLTDEEKTGITEFAELSGVTISKKWEPSVTHVIASTDENGACKRTLKFMMGILEGKWILTIDWIKDCMKNTKYVSEDSYEISRDVHGIRQGPYLGRQRALNKEPKLFNGLKFYIMGDFELSYKGYLQDLIVAAGGTILRRRPISDDNKASTIVVFSVEPIKNKSLTQRRSDAEALAKSAGARAASSSWVLDSIAGCQVLNLV